MRGTAERNTIKIVNDPNHKVPLVGLVSALFGLFVGTGFTWRLTSKLAKRLHIAVPDPAAKNDDDKDGLDGGQAHVGAFDRDAAGIRPEKPGVKGKVLGFAEKHNWRWLGRTLQVQQRYGELQGNTLAASITLQVFLSLFPMLLVASAVVGFVVHNGDSDIPGRIISSMGLTGSAAETMSTALNSASESRKATSVVGFATLVWSAIGVASAIQYGYNQAWQVTARLA